MDRSRITRWAAPVAFLAAVTIGALVVRAGLEHGKQHAKEPTTTVTSRTNTTQHPPKHPRPQTYTIVQGDTLASIAAKEGTTVAKLEKLNPGIAPAALRVGQKIRVQ